MLATKAGPNQYKSLPDLQIGEQRGGFWRRRLEARVGKLEPWRDPRFQWVQRLASSIACISVFLLTIVNCSSQSAAAAVVLPQFTREIAAMKVLVIGAGGREHALVWSIARSGRVSEVLCTPGNAGIAQLARCIPANPRDSTTYYGSPLPRVPTWWWLAPSFRCRWGWWTNSSGEASRFLGRRSRRRAGKQQILRQALHAAAPSPTAAYAVAANEREALESIDLFHLPVVIEADRVRLGQRRGRLRDTARGNRGHLRAHERKAAGWSPVFHCD